MDDTRARFLSEVVSRLGADRIVELHLFSPIRQGSIETGVAVVAVTPSADVEADVPLAVDAGDADAELAGPAEDSGEADADLAPPAEDSGDAVMELASPVVVDVESLADPRLVVHTARYRLVRKGPDRGKWLVEVTATADAPLATVDAVARGVTQRAKDLTETERFSGEQLRALLEDPLWRTPT